MSLSNAWSSWNVFSIECSTQRFFYHFESCRMKQKFESIGLCLISFSVQFFLGFLCSSSVPFSIRVRRSHLDWKRDKINKISSTLIRSSSFILRSNSFCSTRCWIFFRWKFFIESLIISMLKRSSSQYEKFAQNFIKWRNSTIATISIFRQSRKWRFDSFYNRFRSKMLFDWLCRMKIELEVRFNIFSRPAISNDFLDFNI